LLHLRRKDMSRESIIADGGRGFLDAIEKDRYDSTTRLVYSDWLEEHGYDDECLEQRRLATPEWIEADKWLHEYAARVKPYDTETVYGTRDAVVTEEGKERAFKLLMEEMQANELFYHGCDLYSFGEVEEPDELKKYAEIWLHQGINWDDFTFTCSC